MEWGWYCWVPYALLQYSTTPILHVFYLGHHVDLRLDFGSRDDMPLEVHLVGVKTEGQTYELRQVENWKINLFSCLCLCPLLVPVQVQMAERAGGYHKIGA